jgi:hypothetical protein
MDDDRERKPTQPPTSESDERFTREIREILKRNVGNDAKARKELSALLTKHKRDVQKAGKENPKLGAA